MRYLLQDNMSLENSIKPDSSDSLWIPQGINSEATLHLLWIRLDYTLYKVLYVL